MGDRVQVRAEARPRKSKATSVDKNAQTGGLGDGELGMGSRKVWKHSVRDTNVAQRYKGPKTMFIRFVQGFQSEIVEKCKRKRGEKK